MQNYDELIPSLAMFLLPVYSVVVSGGALWN